MMKDWVPIIFLLLEINLQGHPPQKVPQSAQELGGDTTAYHIKGNCWQGAAENL